MSSFKGTITKDNPTGLDLYKKFTEAEYAAARKLVIKFTPGYDVPDHYLVQMTREQINNWTRLYWDHFAYLCPRNKGIETNNCLMTALAGAIIENANLAFINGYCDYSYVKARYDEAKEMIETLPPTFESLKTQFKNIGKAAVAMVVGLVTGGPIGFFVGAGTAVANHVAELRAKQKAQAALILQEQAAKVAQAAAAKAAQEKAAADAVKKQQTQKNLLLYGGVTLLVGACIYISVTD